MAGLAFVLVMLVGACENSDDIEDEPRPALVVGDIARLPDGAVARLNSVSEDVTLPPGLPAPEPGTRLVRVDVEVCAGGAELLVDSAFWLGLGDDHRVYSAHLGVRDLRTLTMAPGTCQRGDVDLALADDVGLAEVLLMDMEHTTVARWSVEGDPDDAPEPLRSDLAADTAAIGSAAELATGGTATLHELTPDPADGMVRIEGEVCAAEEAVHTSPRNWYLQLADHRLLAAERDGATMPEGDLDPGACVSGTIDFSLPAGGDVRAVLYTYGGIYEEARWRIAD